MDRSIYCTDLDFWFNEVESALGERSTLSSTQSCLMRGGASSGIYEEPWADVKLWVWHAQHDRIRRVKERLLRLDRDTYRLLEVHYTAASGVGSANGVDPKHRSRIEYLNRVRARFGELAGVVVHLARTSNVDLFGIKNAKEIDALAEDAEKQLKAAHKAWRNTRPPKKEVQDAPRNYEVPLPVAS